MTNTATGIRSARVGDADRLRAIFGDAVRAVGPQHYRPEQVAMWASFSDDESAWTALWPSTAMWVAEDATKVVGFVCLAPAQHVHLLYVDPCAHRQGVAMALLTHAESWARENNITMLTTNASLISHPLFLEAGYRVDAWEESERNGVCFRRARMSKALP